MSSTPAPDHHPACDRDERGDGHRTDCASPYPDHQIPQAVMDELHADATAERIAWGAVALATAAQSGLRLKTEELHDALRAAGANSDPSGDQLVRQLHYTGKARISLFGHDYRVIKLLDDEGNHSHCRVTVDLADARITEAEFRAKTPHSLGGVEILEVTRFTPGSVALGVSARAAAVTRTNGAFGTHTLIYQEHRDAFHLNTGHYDLPSREAAAQDARQRVLV